MMIFVRPACVLQFIIYLSLCMCIYTYARFIAFNDFKQVFIHVCICVINVREIACRYIHFIFADLTPNKSVPLPIKLYAKYLAFCLFNKTTNYNAFLNAPLRCNKKLVKNRTSININITGSHVSFVC